MLIEIFKTGAHTDSSGHTRAWTEGDLDAIANKYNPAEHEAPVVIGHPKDNAPAFGWVEGLERKGSVLYARLKDLVPEFVDAVKQGLYKKRSISLYPDMTLRHIGFLGAMAPAVKGLADVAFGDSDKPGVMSYEFADYRVNLVGGIFRRLREWLIEKYDPDTADRIVGNWEVEELQREIKETEAVEAPEFKKGGQDMEKIQELETRLREKETALSEFAEKDKAREDETARLRQELESQMAKQRQNEFNSFCDGLMKEGRLTPAMRHVAMDFMEILHSAGEYEFSEGDGKAKAQPVEKFKAFLSGLPKQVEFGEHATKGKAGDALTGTAGEKVAALIRKKMEADKNLSYNAAFSEVQTENYELAAEYAEEIKGGK